MSLNKPRKRLGEKPEIIYLSEIDKQMSLNDDNFIEKDSKSLNKQYLKVKSNDYKKYNEMMKEVNSGKLKWAFYAIDNNHYYHFFSKLK